MRKQPSDRPPRRSLPRRLVRILVKTLLTLIIIILLIFFLVQTPFVQNFARGKAETYLSRKLKVPVRIGHLNINLFRSVALEDIYIPDRNKDTLLAAGLVKVRLRMLGLLHNNLDIQEIQLRDITANILRRSPTDTTFNYQFIIDAFTNPHPGPPDTTTSTPFHIGMNTLLLDNIRFVYADTLTGNAASLNIGHSKTDMRTLDPGKQLYAVAHADFANTTLYYQNSRSKLITTARFNALSTEKLDLDLDKLIFRAHHLQLDSADVSFDDNSKPHQKKGMDYFHLLANRLTLQGDDLTYSADAISGHITKGQFTERSGFRLDQLQTRFLYTDHKTVLDDLLLRTPGTLLQRSATLQYDSIAAITTHPARTHITLDLPNSHVQLKDILVFAPFLASQPVFSHPADTWQINTAIRGTLDNLTIQTIQFSGIKDLKVDIAGQLLHPMDNRRLRADLRIRNLSGSRAALLALVPKNTLPSNITIPAHFDLHGHLTGSRDDITSDLLLNTTSGNIILKGTAGNFRSTTAATYDLNLQTKALQLGTILQDSAQWGAVTADFHIKGTGLDLHSANSKFSGNIKAATYKQYTYHDLVLDGNIANQQAVLHSAINNTAVHFELQASADLAKKFPALKLDWNIDTVDLHALHLVKDTLQLKGHLVADFADTNPDSLQGDLTITGLDLLQGARHIATDSIALIATRQADIQDIQLHSEMADIDWKGRYKVTETATAVEHTIDHYFQLKGFKDTAFTAQDWTMDIHLRPSPLVLALLPTLRGTDTVGGRLSFNSEHNDLHLGLKAPRIVYGTQFLHEIDIAAGTADSSLRYAVTMADGHGSGILLYKTSVSGALQDNRLTTTLLLKDQKGKDRYRLAGMLDEANSALKFKFNPDSLLLNYDQWEVSRDNFILYDSSGLIAHHFTISNDSDSLSFNTNGATGAAPLDVRFGNFRLSTISRLANQDSVIVDGILNGKAEVKNLTTNPIFTSDLLIRNLAYKIDTLGDLTVKVNNEKANAFSADIGLKGKNNDIAVTGDYYTGESKMDLKLDLKQINLAAFSHSAEGYIDGMKGYLTGKFDISGTMDKPNVRGNLYFDSSVITPTISGEPLDVSKDRIAFDEDGFNFSQFELRDSAGNKLVLDGNVFTKDYHSFAFDISLNAQNFRLVNAPENSSRQFYGQLNLDAAINLEGKMDAPKVDGAIRFNKRTNFYYVLPGNDPEVGDRLGVVRFVNHHTGDTLVDKKAIALHRNKEIKGLDVSLNLLSDTSAVFNVVIDPRSGDALNVRGRSNLVFQLEKSGKMDLTGSYEVNGGFYSLSFNLLKRKFAIDRNSIITWTGDPTTATVNLTASYTAQTPSIDLVANEIGHGIDADPTIQNKYRQKLPFLVTLKMNGELLKPTITFDISLPTNILSLWPDVDLRLTQLRTQQSEMNKQVFALLLLGRFVGEDPLASKEGGGASLGNLAFSSASQILTSQMDQLAASLIKGVDIHFDLNNQQDFSTGQEIDYTELGVTLSKQLMDERLRVSVGSNFDVVGTGAPNQAPSNLAGNVGVDYKLSRDGRYVLRAYRQNQYQAVILGQVVETGVGFVITFDYDKFKEIWHRAKGETIGERKTSKSSNSAQ
ncbi:translocation/assembly module TamB domain-containing protein [Puia sp.]|uniref:translocation/assembly module TamB domain-containing protein n=1 Tax=Puia sp. TaxID=2045100 RepID=UPI002F42F4DC